MISTSPIFLFLRALTLIGTAASVAQAQRVARSSGSCDGQIIRSIHVTALRPPFTGGAAYWQRVARSFGLHHQTTDTAVVRRFLALDEGGTCTDFRLRESARLLREQPFLADARVRALPDDSGGVRV